MYYAALLTFLFNKLGALKLKPEGAFLDWQEFPRGRSILTLTKPSRNTLTLTPPSAQPEPRAGRQRPIHLPPQCCLGLVPAVSSTTPASLYPALDR